MVTGQSLSGECWGGDWISPRGVDLQINGGLGLAFPELTKADLPRLNKLQERLWKDGIEAISPTLVTCGIEALRTSLTVLRDARENNHRGLCQLLGAHLEGPFISEAKLGAHPRKHLAAPTLSALEERIAGFEKEIAIFTLAPELEGAIEVIKRLKELKIKIALGHSAANENQAALAFDNGVEMITHVFNAMPGLHHRDPGPLGEACLRGDIALGLIADGIHVAPSIATLLQKLAPEQILLVSDALAPYGLSDGVHQWDNRKLLVSKGTCRLEDGTLAGVSLPQLEGAKRLAAWSKAPGPAIWSATVAPRKIIGAEETMIGRSLEELLRWSISPDDKLLWRSAA